MNDAIYTDLAADYDRLAGASAPNGLYDRPTMLRLLGPLDGRDVLELGSASGHLTTLLADAGASVLGLDKSAEMVDLARARVGDRARFEVVDLSGPLPVATESVDLVSASLLLHYLPDWSGVLAEARRALRAGGVIVLSVHHPITGWLRSDRTDYHRTELIGERWTVGGAPIDAHMWRRPFSAVLTALLDASFSIDAVEEPCLHLTAEQVPDEQVRSALNTEPVFLYVRGRRL